MGESLRPSDFGLPDVRITKFKNPKLCRICLDTFTFYRWGGNNYCPDCDIKRMKRLDDNMREIEKKFGLTPISRVEGESVSDCEDCRIVQAFHPQNICGTCAAILREIIQRKKEKA